MVILIPNTSAACGLLGEVEVGEDTDGVGDTDGLCDSELCDPLDVGTVEGRGIDGVGDTDGLCDPLDVGTVEDRGIDGVGDTDGLCDPLDVGTVEGRGIDGVGDTDGLCDSELCDPLGRSVAGSVGISTTEPVEFLYSTLARLSTEGTLGKDC
ncbi:hypothetical protein [Streptomyces sp. NPDC048508]|uniref:hypothetical protein n=1 Tax=Streptomyces sp. NPDC048508 TaxID=3365561 RepID=UPI0037238466